MQKLKYFKPATKFVRGKYGTREYPEILRHFHKTPKTIVCPHFWELNWAYGCPFNCAYCYLQGTLRGNKRFRSIPLNHVLSTLRHQAPKIPNPVLFNSGELTDSLADPFVMEKIVDEFEKQDKHKILLLTKSSNIGFLLKRVRRQTIVSFSINAPTVWKLWEKGTPHPKERIKAAKKLSKVGYKVRIRIDPIFPIKNWQNEYGKLVELLLSELTPERITLGTPRGLYKTKIYAKDLSWWKLAFEKYPSENSGWGKKIATPLREEIYFFLINKLRKMKFNNPITLCKETETMWRRLGLNPGNSPYWKNCKCNCVWSEMQKGILEIKEHSYKKYRILKKYLAVCKRFSDKYRNFVYIDTHGGSGKVLNVEKDNLEDGSPLIARKINPDFPCHIIEINPNRYKVLEKSVKNLPNIAIMKGDCNKEIDKILKKIPKWKFTFCFIDPDGLIEEDTKCHELSWGTVEKIAQKRTEILLTFQLEAITRLIGYIYKFSDPTAKKFEGILNDFFGNDKWKRTGTDRKKLLKLYFSERLGKYEYKGAILIKADHIPLYYLVFATKHRVGAKIMRDIMKEEWRPKQQSLINLDKAFPINYFIFE